MELALPPGLPTLERPMTVAELMQLPEGPPYPELLDGELVVDPQRLARHQVAIGNLHVLLRVAAPPGLRVMLGPYGWAADTYNVFEPDLLVASRVDVVDHLLQQPPLLCVEVLSPSNRRDDLVRKRVTYERAGVANYWIFDPADSTLLVLELIDGAYHEVDRPGGRTSLFTATRPFPVSVDPARLLD